MNAVRIVVFAKAPVPGRVKTRLIPALGEAGAAQLAERMLEQALQQALAAAVGPVELCMSPAPDAPEWAGIVLQPGIETTDQGEGDLGARMARAAQRAIARREAVLLTGTDCPDLTADRLRAAAAQLAGHDAVLHRAEDGGYPLLGLRAFDAGLFQAIPWSTPAVAGLTLQRLAALGWTVWVGDTLRDIDEPADLIHAGAIPGFRVV
jgi:rSAM/selenodomain-associated transferase 1